MQQKTINVYNFNELKPQIQEKVIDKFRYSDVSYEWYEFLFDDFKEELKEIGLSCKTFYFDFDRNRHIEADNLKVIEPYLLFEKADVLKYLLANLDYKINMSLSIDKNNNVYLEDYEENFTHKEVIEQNIQILISNKLNSFLKRLEEDYYYLTSDECIKENIESNEYQFLENGDLI